MVSPQDGHISTGASPLKQAGALHRTSQPLTPGTWPLSVIKLT